MNTLEQTLLTLRYHLLSRNGKIVVAVVVVLIALLWINRSSADPGSHSTSERKNSDGLAKNNASSPIHSASKNESFEFFNPKKFEEESETSKITEVTEFPTRFELPPPPTPAAGTPIIFEPLIKEQRQAATPEKPELFAATYQLPTLEQGATLHCQLLFPATSHQSNSPVIAQVTRPLIRDGITLIPAGSKVFGKVQGAKGQQLFFGTEWKVTNSTGTQMSLTANALQKGGGANDGQTGMPGLLENLPPPENLTKLLARSIIKGVAEIGKDTIRTGVGEYIPSSGRNAAITGGSAVLDQILTPDKTSTENKPYVNVPAGNEFYLVVSSQGQASQTSQGTGSSTETLDGLLEQMMRKRLE